MALIDVIPPKRGNPAWVKGKTTNPGGVSSLAASFEDPGPRAKFLVKQHGIDIILKAMADPALLAKSFSTYDGMIIMGVANSLRGNGEERERMFNRMFGKVPDKQINMNLNIDIAPEQLTNRAHDMLARLVTGDDSEDDLIEE